jgi:hypothetical protein
VTHGTLVQENGQKLGRRQQPSKKNGKFLDNTTKNSRLSKKSAKNLDENL